MTNLIKLRQDLLLRSKYSLIELNKLILKSLLYNDSLAFYKKFYYIKLFYFFNTKLSLSKFRNFSVLSGYPRSIFRFFKLSRHECKNNASFGFLTGLRKSSF